MPGQGNPYAASFRSSTNCPFEVDIWAIDISHPFIQIDKSWLMDIAANLENKNFIENI